MVFLPLRADLLCILHYETPCRIFSKIDFLAHQPNIADDVTYGLLTKMKSRSACEILLEVATFFISKSGLKKYKLWAVMAQVQ